MPSTAKDEVREPPRAEAEAALASPDLPPEDELEEPSGSIKTNLKKNLAIFQSYLRLSGEMEDSCISNSVLLD